MINTTRTVIVRQLPGALDRSTERAFFHDLESAMNEGRPALVIDCSQMREISCSAIYLLLCCLEKAMKRNGDVRLAAVSPQAMENLRAMDVDRLFRIFESSEIAVESFHRRGTFVTLPAPADSTLASENAA